MANKFKLNLAEVSSVAKAQTEAFQSLSKKQYTPRMDVGVHEGCRLIGLEISNRTDEKWYQGVNVVFEKDGRIAKKWLGFAKSPDITTVPFKSKGGKLEDFVWSQTQTFLIALFGLTALDASSTQMVSATVLSNASAIAEALKDVEYTVELQYPCNKPYIIKQEDPEAGVRYAVMHTVPKEKGSREFVTRIYKIVNPVTGKPLPPIYGEDYVSTKTALLAALKEGGYPEEQINKMIGDVEFSKHRPVTATSPIPEEVTSMVEEIVEYVEANSNRVSVEGDDDGDGDDDGGGGGGRTDSEDCDALGSGELFF